MSVARDAHTSVTTWGYKEVEDQTWQVWRVRRDGELVAELVVPRHVSAVDVLVTAVTMLESTPFPWKESE